MDIIVFRRRQVMPPPTGSFIFTTARLHYRFASVAADSCSLHHGYAILSPWWSNFIFIIFGIGKLYCLYFTNHDDYKSFDTLAYVTKYDAVLFYYNKWCSNLQYLSSLKQ
uniref:HGWP repeat containing protein-like n=1 Tax=Oryza sativa subsp. japonica TaxID=39947 RepID=Q6EPQ4_ORYSJ|nr:HGWP repeat containing protein-like [Oryza sativa Japonica Group]BAD29366.1 HGWP repeat containing protein-like [Oryza sativa Japonica Group]